MKREHLSAAVHKVKSLQRAGLRHGKVVAVALATSLVLGMGAAPAWAYFTDTHHADGGLPINGQPETEIHEWYAEATKHVTITNEDKDGFGTPVYVRAKVQTSLPYTVSGNGWSAEPDEDHWYYYDTKVEPGAETEDLTVKITFPTVQSEEQPDGAVYGDNFDVIVLYEAVPVIYDEDGNEVVDWDNVVYEGSEGGN